MAVALVGSLALALVVLVFYRAGQREVIRRHGQALRNAPDTLPLAGNGLVFLRSRHRLFSWFARCERQFGFETFAITVPSLPPGAVINDPAILEYVLKNEGIFSKGDFVKSRSWDLFGNGIINSDGPMWKAQRRAGLNFLNIANLEVLTDVVLPQHLQETIEILQGTQKDDVIDLETIFSGITTKLMGRMAYGMDMHADDSFFLAFDYASGATGNRFQNPLWPITELFFGGKFRRSIAEVKKFGRKIVANAVESRSAEISDEASKEHQLSGSLIKSLLDTIPDHETVADAALNYLTAGRDTTGQSLTWTFYLLMRHPEVTAKIRQELASLNNDESPEQAKDLNLSAMRPSLLPYTLSVFYESLRLYPPIPFEIRQCERATTLPDGTFLPTSAVLVWCIWAMNRSTRIWGADATLFRPERWFQPDEEANNDVKNESRQSSAYKPKMKTRSAFEYPVFNGGPRACLGKKMAESIAVMVIAALVARFDFLPYEEPGAAGAERISKNSLTLPMQGGLPCFVKARA